MGSGEAPFERCCRSPCRSMARPAGTMVGWLLSYRASILVALLALFTSLGAEGGLPARYGPTGNSSSSLLYDLCPGRNDFFTWRKSGVTPKTVQMALNSGGWRYKIVGGRLYLGLDQFLPQDGLPTKRDFFVILGMLRLTQKYGDALPNVEFVIQNHDDPKVKVASKKPPQYVRKFIAKGKLKSAATKDPPLMFASFVSNGQKISWDIPWPQYTFWGENLCKRASDPPWKQLREELIDSWIPFSQRNASLFWSGAPNTPVRMAATKCTESNFFVNRAGMQKVFGAGKCNFKYLMYADGKFSSTSILPIVGCGSIPLVSKSPWTNAWSRCLQPYKHYLPLTSNPKMVCADLKAKIDWAESNPEKAEEIASNVQKFVREALSMDSVYDYMKRRLEDYRRLMKFNPVVRPGRDVHIGSFDDLVKVLDSVMKKMKMKTRAELLEYFIAYNKGSRCCCDCPNIPAFQNLCPGKDLGWLEP